MKKRIKKYNQTEHDRIYKQLLLARSIEGIKNEIVGLMFFKDEADRITEKLEKKKRLHPAEEKMIKFLNKKFDRNPLPNHIQLARFSTLKEYSKVKY